MEMMKQNENMKAKKKTDISIQENREGGRP